MHGTVRLAAGVLLAAALASAAPAGTGTLHYARDAAGRLVRVGDGTGMFREYRFDRAGNALGSSLRRMWHLSVKKPAKGAWVLGVDAGGAVSGHGVDASGTVFTVGGTLDLSSGAPEGVLEQRDPDTDALLASFTLAKSKLKTDGGGNPDSMILKGSGGGGALVAKAARPSGGFDGFSGVYGGAKSSLKLGSAKSHPGVVALCSEGTRPAFSVLDGEGLGGFLVRDFAGKAYGVLDTEEGEVPVLGKLKDGSKAVSLKSAKGAPVKLQLKVKK